MSKEFETEPNSHLTAEEALYKAVAETGCLAYHLTKIPLIRLATENLGGRLVKNLSADEVCHCLNRVRLNGAERLYEATQGAVTCNCYDWVEACFLRTQLFCESLAARAKKSGSLAEAWQTEGEVWEKIKKEEAEELATGIRDFLQVLPHLDLKNNFPSLTREMGTLHWLSSVKELDAGRWLRIVFRISRELGVSNELNLVRFMAEKQRSRIASRKKNLTQKDKEEEWQRLLPLARQYFQ